MGLPLPEGKFEAALSNRVSLYDVSHMLPRNDAFAPYPARNVRKISHVLIHKSGADGPDGFTGIKASAAYFTSLYRGKGAPGFPYTYWCPRVPDMDAEGRYVVYRGNLDITWSWHSGSGMNEIGVAVCAQGNFDGDGGRVERAPTEAQMACVSDLVDWLEERHKLEYAKPLPDGDYSLTGHWEHGKPVCPGDYLRAWVEERRGSAQRMPPTRPPAAGEVEIRNFSVLERKKALRLLDITYRPSAKDRWDYEDRAALERFQVAQGLKADGWWGPQSMRAMLTALRKHGFAERSVFETL